MRGIPYVKTGKENNSILYILSFIHWVFSYTHSFNSSRGEDAQAWDCKCDGCGFDFHSRKMKYLIFSFSRFGNEAKRCTEFRYSTRNAFKIRRKVENETLWECLITMFIGALWRKYIPSKQNWIHNHHINTHTMSTTLASFVCVFII